MVRSRAWTFLPRGCQDINKAMAPQVQWGGPLCLYEVKPDGGGSVQRREGSAEMDTMY